MSAWECARREGGRGVVTVGACCTHTLAGVLECSRQRCVREDEPAGIHTLAGGLDPEEPWSDDGH